MIIKYNNTVITNEFLSGKWSHPVTGVKYPSDWDASTIEGVTVEVLPEPEPPSPEPTGYVTTPAKLRLVLLGAGLLDTVEAAVQQADRETQLMWEFSLEYLSNHPKLVAMATALGINQEQMDALFMQAQEV